MNANNQLAIILIFGVALVACIIFYQEQNIITMLIVALSSIYMGKQYFQETPPTDHITTGGENA